MNEQLKELLNHVRTANVNSPERVQSEIDSFLRSQWSLLSDEWINHMSAVEKRAFSIKVFKQTR
jgi:hypothetical protein